MMKTDFARLFLRGAILFAFTHADEGYFWQITDYHYDPTYGFQMRSCNDEVPDPGYYGNEWCDSSWGLVIDSLQSMNKIRGDVDFILWTGDSIPHIDDAFMDQSYILDIMRNVTNAILTTFPTVPVFPTMGNNDWYLSDQFSPSSHPIYTSTASMWESWLPEDQLKTFRQGGFYTMKTAHGLRIVGLNTNVYYFRDKLTSNTTDPVGQFQWLEDVMERAKADNEKVLMTGHIPPGVHASTQLQWYYDRFNHRFISIVKRYADIIVGIFCGHEHGDGLRLIQRGTHRVPVYLAPALTPWRFKIPDLTGPPHYPAIRLVRYDRTSSLPLAIHQYYLNLTEANRYNKSDWKVAYTTEKAYGMTDLSGESLEKAMKKMKTDKYTLDRYILNINVLGDIPVNDCDTLCRARILCSFTHLNKSDFEMCVSPGVNVSRRLLSPCVLVMMSSMFGFLLH